jgi:hypothetical protein
VTAGGAESRNKARRVLDDPVVDARSVRQEKTIPQLALLDGERERSTAACDPDCLLNGKVEVGPERLVNVTRVVQDGWKIDAGAIGSRQDVAVLRSAPGHARKPAHWSWRLAGSYWYWGFEQSVEKKLDPDADVGEADDVFGGRRGIAAPRVASQPRRQICAVDDQILWFAHLRWIFRFGPKPSA